jgi:hypothetical protein
MDTHSCRLPLQLPASVGPIAAAAAVKEDICWEVLNSMSDKELEEVRVLMRNPSRTRRCRGQFMTVEE